MDRDDLHHAVPGDPLPPENKVSCALESVNLMRRMVAILMARAGLNNLHYMKVELDLAPVETLMVTRDKQGNVTVTMES